MHATTPNITEQFVLYVLRMTILNSKKENLFHGVEIIKLKHRKPVVTRILQLLKSNKT